SGFGSRISTLGIVPPLAHALAVSRRGELWDLNSSTGVTCRAQRDDHGKLLFVPFRQQRRRVRRRPISAAAGRCFAGLGAFLTEAKAEPARFAGLPGPLEGPFRDPRAEGFPTGHFPNDRTSSISSWSKK
ncbi:hypothetical protein THAOC_28317, partial [Thalassiosira oceanica]